VAATPRPALLMNGGAGHLSEPDPQIRRCPFSTDRLTLWAVQPVTGIGGPRLTWIWGMPSGVMVMVKRPWCRS